VEEGKRFFNDAHDELQHLRVRLSEVFEGLLKKDLVEGGFEDLDDFKVFDHFLSRSVVIGQVTKHSKSLLVQLQIRSLIDLVLAVADVIFVHQNLEADLVRVTRTVKQVLLRRGVVELAEHTHLLQNLDLVHYRIRTT